MTTNAEFRQAIEDEGWNLPCMQNPNAFFSPDLDEDGRYAYNDAKRLCAQCPIANVCLSYAIANDERYGVWGGLSTNERNRMRAARNRLLA